MTGQNIRIRELVPQDIESIAQWDLFRDPLLRGYNYADLPRKDRENWYVDKALTPSNRYFAVTLKDGRFIAYVGVKKIHWRLRSALLGIVMDPAYTSKGYGEEVLRLFLDLYFRGWKMRKMELEVNDFNKRALNLYHKLGFEWVRTYQGLFEIQDISDSLLAQRGLTSSFMWRFGRLYAVNHKMRLERGRYLNETED